MATAHIPVMLNEVIGHLDPLPGDNFIDCTLGGGGYTNVIAELVGTGGGVLAIERDPRAIERVRESSAKKFSNIKYAHGNFQDLEKIVKEYWPETLLFSGIVFDLGLSTDQLEDQDRGLSFQLDGPLDMRLGGENEKRPTAAQLVNTIKEAELIKILRDYGEERYARLIARKIVATRKTERIDTTAKLREIITAAVPASYRRGRINPATKTFQALRIGVNEELSGLTAALPQAINLLKPGGRIAVVSYHSLEDRIVKNTFKMQSRDCLCPPAAPVCFCGHRALVRLVTKKAVRPSPAEISRNPRARSARLRVAEKII